MGVVKTAAPIAANIVLPGSGSIVGGLMDTVLKTTGYGPDQLIEMSDEKKAEIINASPELMAQLKSKAMELEATIAQEQTKNMEQVAGTMQAELKDGRWYQRAWRPFNGFMFPIAVLSCYVGIPVWAWYTNALVTIEVPASLWMIWGGILGVAVYGRNQEKQQKPSANAAGGIMKIINKLRS